MDKADELKIAKRIVREGPGTFLGDPPLKARPFGKLWLLTPEEVAEFEAFKMLITRYLDHEQHQRPLCLAIFGPPGSGKTTAAREVWAAAGEDKNREKWKEKLLFRTVNLTQVPDARALGLRLAEIAREVRKGEVPFILFDEFDTARAGVPLGWLSWFLAAMNDGEWIVDGWTRTLYRAIHVFAGGTAHRFAEFGARRSRRFKLAKGPDFVSRLRGYLDVRGVNDPTYTEIRRALVLHNQLTRQAQNLGLPEKEHMELTSDLQSTLLHVGRYRHGARSIEAVVEMASKNVRPTGTKPPRHILARGHLPPDHLIDLHVDRGVLDPGHVGGGIQLCGGALTPDQKHMEPHWKVLAEALWRAGATLAYGGAPARPGKPNLTTILRDEAEAWAPTLRQKQISRPKPGQEEDRLRFRWFPPAEFHQSRTVTERLDPAMQRESVPGITAQERRRIPHPRGGAPVRGTVWDRLSQSIILFRMRLQMAETHVAMVAIGGKTRGFSGRLPGIAEEIMLALTLGRPVYLCGGVGGFVREVGSLLALRRPWSGDPQSLFRPKGVDWTPFDNLLEEWEYVFRPPPHTDLPLTPKGVLDLFRSHALSGPKWPDNGLSLAENRQLFSERDPKKAADLVVLGLSRRFGSA